MAKRSTVGTAIVISMIVAGIVSAFVINHKRQTSAAGAKAILAADMRKVEDLPVIATVADFSLTERSGKPVTLDMMRGKVWIADSFFTYCGAECPTMTGNMAQLHREFIGKDEPRFVSITSDPTRDTGEALTEFARTYQADTDRWWFLTGDEREIQKLALSMLLTYELGKPASHSNRFVLIDREGQVRGTYPAGKGTTALDELRRDLKLLLADKQSG